MTGQTEPQVRPAISIMVLAGGQSKRLGQDKSLLLVDGEPLVSHIAYRLTALSDDLMVVTNDPARYKSLGLPARLVPDEHPGKGSLMGIYSGLKASHHPHTLTVACDMPFLSLSLLRYMAQLAEGYDIVVPRLGSFLEPLHAIYGRACLPAIARLLEQGRRQIIGFYREARVRYVEEDEIDRFDPLHLSFVNVNTVEDWEQVQELLVEQK